MNNVKQYFSRLKFFDKNNIRREEVLNRELEQIAGFYGKDFVGVKNLYDTYATNKNVLSHKDMVFGLGNVDNYLRDRMR
jgi:hypothetical protein